MTVILDSLGLRREMLGRYQINCVVALSFVGQCLGLSSVGALAQEHLQGVDEALLPRLERARDRQAAESSEGIDQQFPALTQPTEEESLGAMGDIPPYQSARFLDMLNAGHIQSSLGYHVEAIASYDEAIRLMPGYGPSYRMRANTKCKLGKYKEAIADYDKAIELEPDFAGNYMLRGVAKSKLPENEEAILDYDQAIELEPAYSLTYQLRATAKSQIGDFGGAVEDLDKLLALEPLRIEHYQVRGKLRSILGDYKGALADFDRVLQEQPFAADTYKDRAVCKSHLQDYEGSLADFEKAESLGALVSGTPALPLSRQ